MSLEEHVYIALIAALVNFVLSVIVPCALKGYDNFLPEIRKMLEHHRATLFSSSVLVAVIVFLSLQAAPVIKNELIPNYVLNLARLSRTPSV
jgi:hypothetical protein